MKDERVHLEMRPPDDETREAEQPPVRLALGEHSVRWSAGDGES